MSSCVAAVPKGRLRPRFKRPAETDWLRVDPTPGKNKSLLIRYRYHDTPRMFMVTGNNLVSYQRADVGGEIAAGRSAPGRAGG